MRPLPIALLLWALAPPAGAEPVRFDWTGTVSFADASLAGAGIVVGAPAAGDYRFEAGVADGDADPGLGIYDDALLHWHVAVGSIDGTTTEQGFGVVTVDLDFDGMGQIYQVNPGPDVLLRLWDTDGTALTNDSLPSLPPDLSDFEAAAVVQLDPGTQQPLAVIDLETLTLTPPAVPVLPGWAFALGAIALIASAARIRSAIGGRSALSPPA